MLGTVFLSPISHSYLELPYTTMSLSLSDLKALLDIVSSVVDIKGMSVALTELHHIPYQPAQKKHFDAWEEKYWHLFKKYRSTCRGEISFQHWQLLFQQEHDDNFIILLGLCLISPAEDSSLMERIVKALERSFPNPTPVYDVASILERLVRAINKGFKAFFPETFILLPHPLKKFEVLCSEPTNRKCPKRYSISLPVCGNSRQIVALEPVDANDQGIINVSRVFPRLHQNLTLDPIDCMHCFEKGSKTNKVTKVSSIH
jgi:hypothetical protein